jgi:5-formyltetrahydrofolate cyclo-ligase
VTSSDAPIPLDPEPAGVERIETVGDVLRAKHRLRREIRRRVEAMPPEARAEAGRSVREAIEGLGEYAKARSVLFYAALPDEVDLGPLIDEALEAGREVLLPVCEPERCEIRIVSVEDPARDLCDGFYGIMEPREGLPLGDAAALDLVLVPGRAFDSGGNRLGRGRGYYDNFLSRLAPRRAGGAFKLGVCFACQLVERVPVMPKDVKVDAVVTEDGAIRRP